MTLTERRLVPARSIASYGYGCTADGLDLDPDGTNTVAFGTSIGAGDVAVRADAITVATGVYEVTLSVRSESTSSAIWWVDTADDYVQWPGSMLYLPAAATSSVTFVATATTDQTFRPRYVSGTRADFHDIQLTVVELTG